MYFLAAADVDAALTGTTVKPIRENLTRMILAFIASFDVTHDIVSNLPSVTVNECNHDGKQRNKQTSNI